MHKTATRQDGLEVFKNNLMFYSRDEVERMFENKDKDLDGRLSFEEFMGEKTRAERLFQLMDKDGDGYVTKHVRLVRMIATSLFLLSDQFILITLF